MMGTLANQDFTTLLDDLIAAQETVEPSAAPPTIPFDYLAVADDLLSGRIRVFDDEIEAEYRDTASVEALKEPVAEPASLLPIEPEAIEHELALAEANVADLARIRRRFAFANHPDRVAPHLRDRAMVRMQIANMLIDKAAQRAALG